MTPSLHLQSWHAVCMNLTTLLAEAGTEEKKDNMGLFVCAQNTDVLILLCVWDTCESVHTFQLQACVFGFQAVASRQPTSSALCFSQHSQCAQRRGWKTRGEKPREPGGRPSPPATADRSQLVQSRHPEYNTFNICFGLVCVLLKNALEAWAVTFLTCNNYSTSGACPCLKPCMWHAYFLANIFLIHKVAAPFPSPEICDLQANEDMIVQKVSLHD